MKEVENLQVKMENKQKIETQWQENIEGKRVGRGVIVRKRQKKRQKSGKQ